MKKSYLTASIFAVVTFVGSASIPFSSFAEVKDLQALRQRLDENSTAKARLETLVQAKKDLPTGALLGFVAIPNGARAYFKEQIDLASIGQPGGFINGLYDAGYRGNVGYTFTIADERFRKFLDGTQLPYRMEYGYAYANWDWEDMRGLLASAPQGGINTSVKAVTLYDFPVRAVLGNERLDDVIGYLEAEHSAVGKGGEKVFPVVNFLDGMPQKDRDTVFVFGEVYKGLGQIHGFKVYTEMLLDDTHLRIHATAPAGSGGVAWTDIYRVNESLFREKQETKGDFAFTLDGFTPEAQTNFFYMLDANGIPYERNIEGFLGREWHADLMYKFNHIALNTQAPVNLIYMRVTVPVSRGFTQALEARRIDADAFVKTVAREYKY